MVLLAPTVEHLVEEAKLRRDDARQREEDHCEDAHGRGPVLLGKVLFILVGVSRAGYTVAVVGAVLSVVLVVSWDQELSRAYGIWNLGIWTCWPHWRSHPCRLAIECRGLLILSWGIRLLSQQKTSPR